MVTKNIYEETNEFVLYHFGFSPFFRIGGLDLCPNSSYCTNSNFPLVLWSPEASLSLQLPWQIGEFWELEVHAS